MARKAPAISIEDLKIKIGAAAKRAAVEELEPEEMEDPFESAFTFLYFENAQVRSDLRKIDFDFENYSTPNEDNRDTNTDRILGWHTLPNGFSFLGCWAGGDWETPVYFILYWDGEKVRGYVPEDGNTFNSKYRTAYGSEGNSPKYANDKSYYSEMEALFGTDWEDAIQDLNPVQDEYLNNIVNRIKVS